MQRAHQPVHYERRQRPVDAGVLDADLGRQRHPLGGLRHRGDGPGGDPVDRAHQQLGAADRQASQQRSRGVARPDGLGDDTEDGAGVHALVEEERRRAGHLVAGTDRVLHRGGAAPRGQQREVQVDPPVRRHVEGGAGDDRSIGDDRDQVGSQLGQRPQELRVARVTGLEHRHPRLLGDLGDRGGSELPAPPGGRIGAGDDSHHLVIGREQRAQARDCRSGGPGEDEAHGVDARAPGRRWRAGSP